MFSKVFAQNRQRSLAVFADCNGKARHTRRDIRIRANSSRRGFWSRDGDIHQKASISVRVDSSLIRLMTQSCSTTWWWFYQSGFQRSIISVLSSSSCKAPSMNGDQRSAVIRIPHHVSRQLRDSLSLWWFLLCTTIVNQVNELFHSALTDTWDGMVICSLVGVLFEFYFETSSVADLISPRRTKTSYGECQEEKRRPWKVSDCIRFPSISCYQPSDSHRSFLVQTSYRTSSSMILIFVCSPLYSCTWPIFATK